MRLRTRLLLALLGLVLLGLAAAALAYAVLPNPVDGGVFPIPPALLIPPGAP